MSDSASHFLPACAAPVPLPARAVFLPREHGSWFLVLEPLALGLWLVPSWAGGALAGAVLAAFFARRPLRAAGSPIHSLRRQVARETVVMWSALAVAGVAEAGVLGGWAALWPLLPAGMLGLVFLQLDLGGEARNLRAEIAGSAAFSLVPAALAILAGAPVSAAAGLAALAATRSVGSVLVVRAALRPGGRVAAFVAVWSGVLLLAGLAAAGGLRWFAPLAAGVLALRAAWLLNPHRIAWPARKVGQAEAAWGLVYLLLAIASWPSP